jgi:phospho-N-acetylmuramoyl-pentapeptide-transferase
VIRLLVAAAVALALSLLGTKLLMDALIRRKIGQPIHEDLPGTHQVKAGTPTPGGPAIVLAALLAYVISDLLLKVTERAGVFTYTGIFTMLAIAGAGLVGFLDDWIKIRNERNLGLSKRAKSVGLLAVACGFPALMLWFSDETGQHTTLSFTRFDSPGIDLGNVGWFLLAALTIVAVTNAVNLTDGMDGLAGGSAIFAFAAFVVIGFWAFRHPTIYETPHALDLAVIAAAMLGACTGFLWWNAAPARIFMGDTGSLALGAALACLGLTTNTLLLLIIVGGLFAMETMSVILQVASFRLFGGRRIFKMAPIHHHFEQKGWPETTVIIRFWILAGLFTALALGFFYADYVSIPGAVD